MKKRILVLLIGIVLSTPAYAAHQCYSPLELKAEQWLRLHSELMVITVTCHQGSQGDNLVPFYTGFTHRHLAVLHNAEQILIRHYKVSYGGDGLEQLDKLRTKLGNEYGQKIADQSAPMFCSLERDKVIDLYGADTAKVEREVQTLIESAKPYEQPCDGAIATLASKGK